MELQKLQRTMDGADSIVFFGGAGVSTESGIPDFRSVDGLYHQRYQYPPEVILSHRFFMENPQAFYEFYRAKMLVLDAKPNPAHLTLAKLERAGKLRAVITQNIDGLHQAAGSENVLELHGSVHRNHCMQCGQAYPVSAIVQSTGVPLCTLCGGIIKPDVVLYEESLDEAVMQKSIAAIADADMVIVGGTSLGVYPAAGLLRYYRGDKLVLINKTATPMDDAANLVLHGKIGEILGALTL
ncbi:MAG: NAD-dependent protein deacylase [Ruthenibacterium sp.]